MANLQQIANCLMNLSVSDTRIIKTSQIQLENLSRGQNFIHLLLTLIETDGVSTQLAIRASVYTLTYVRNLVLWRNQSLINNTGNKIIQFINKKNINFKYRDQVGAALQYLIQKDQQNIIVLAFAENMINILQDSLNTHASQINFQYIAIMSEALADKTVPAAGGKIQNYIFQSFITLSHLSKILLQATLEAMTNESLLENHLLLITKMLKVLKKYIKKFMYFHSKLTETLQSVQFYNLICYSLTFNLPQNMLATPIFYLNEKCQASKIIEHFHGIKSLTVYLLTQSVRILLNTKLQSINVSQSKIMRLCPDLINNFSTAVSVLLEKTPYYQLKSILKIKTIQQIYIFFTVMLKSGLFYHHLSEVKHIMIFSCAFKTLAFAPADYDNYYNDSEQFVNSLFQIVSLDGSLLARNEKIENGEDSNVQVQVYDTLKTHSAQLIIGFTKYLDTVLPQILIYIINVIDDKINLQSSKSLMFVLLCILRDPLKTRNDYLFKLKKLIFKNIRDLEIPTHKSEQPYNIQFTMTLFTLNWFLLLIDQIVDETDTIEKTFMISQDILKTKNVQIPAKIIASQIILTISRAESFSSFYCRRTIQFLNSIMSFSNLNKKHLECIEQIIKENDNIFKNQYSVILEMVQKVSNFLVSEMKKKNYDMNIALKLWHILIQVTESKYLASSLADTIKRATQPLLDMINGENQLQVEQKIYLILYNLVKATKKVSQHELQVLSKLTKTFYLGKNKKSFSSSFALLQIIIENGKQIINSNSTVVKTFVTLILENISSTTVNQEKRNQTDYLQGILLLQSLIITVGNSFDYDIWFSVTSCLLNKLKKQLIIYDFVRANIISTLTLILSNACHFFPPNDCEQIMKIILNDFSSLRYYLPAKVFIIAASNFLQMLHQPFVCCRYPQILDYIVTMLKSAIILKQSKQLEQMDSQQKEYLKLVSMVKNYYMTLDEFEYFKSFIHTIKEKNKAFLEQAYRQLPGIKQAYLRELLNMRTVNQQPRLIFKLKGVDRSQGKMHNMIANSREDNSMNNEA